MITSKQRSKLRGMANTMEPVTQVGKGGITPAVVHTLSEALEKRELIKVTVLPTVDKTPREVCEELAALLNAEPVQAIGNKITLYRVSSRKDVTHISLD
ncbi:MAG: YhbY family RNA-binding protein [Clostridia bacterium]|nr:YhbY family RNA-binding protein [Clostridia bacterium]